jgi:cytochrome c-type biogenesis protein CcmH
MIVRSSVKRTFAGLTGIGLGTSLATIGMNTVFSVLLGFMAGIAAAFFAVQLWRGPVVTQTDESVPHAVPRNRWLIAGVLAGFLVISVVVYWSVGRPGVASSTTAAATSTAPAHAMDSATATAGAGSMADVTAKLAAKLSAGGGSDADWQLLQQSYEFLGDAGAAELAKQHKLKTSGASMATAPVNAAPVTPSSITPSSTTAQPGNQAALAAYQQQVARNPNDATAWQAIAQLQRSARNFAEAGNAFAKLIKLKVMDADSWADYADVEASLAGSLSNANAQRGIDEALKLNPQQSKALWLKASLALEEKRYADALAVWLKLRSIMPANSPDVAILDANIAETRQLAGIGTSATPAANAASAQVRGNVVVDSSMQKLATSDMTLFIYAKATDSPAPVAAYRGAVSKWPVSFVLDDDHSMMPSRKLSHYQQVRVEARLSRSGQAMPQSGDLQADAIMVDTHSTQPVTLKISRQVP